MKSWQMGEVRGILLKDWTEVSKQGEEMDKFLLPQRLLENNFALLSVIHCIRDVAKLLNKVTQLWGDF